MKPRFYFCELWRMNYYFYYGWKAKDFTNYLLKNYQHELDMPATAVGHSSMLSKDEKCRIHIWVKKKSDYPTLAHECLHAANRTLGRAGWESDLWNDEPQTYLMTNLIRQCLGKGMNG